MSPLRQEGTGRNVWVRKQEVIRDPSGGKGKKQWDSIGTGRGGRRERARAPSSLAAERRAATITLSHDDK